MKNTQDVTIEAETQDSNKNLTQDLTVEEALNTIVNAVRSLNLKYHEHVSLEQCSLMIRKALSDNDLLGKREV